MNWINLECTTLDSEEFLGAEPVERATWLCLLRYCVGQENRGRIEGAREWKDRKWQQVVRVTAREIAAECDLWTWEGDDLVVAFYPVDKEEEVRRNRENGQKGGRPRKPKTEPGQKPGENHPVSEIETTRFDSAETERKGKERKGSTPTPPKGAREDRSPSIEDCETCACGILPASKAFAASVARQFHAMFAVKNWLTQSGHDLLEGQAWKHRLRQMLEEEARKSQGRGGSPRGSPQPKVGHSNSYGETSTLD